MRKETFGFDEPVAGQSETESTMTLCVHTPQRAPSEALDPRYMVWHSVPYKMLTNRAERNFKC